jgi:dihydrofolate reductase
MSVFFSVTMSLDGFIAPVPGERWGAQWMELQAYVFEQRFFRENLKLGEGGETGDDNRLLEQTYARTGATIIGKRMFELGEQGWPEEAPFHTPVFVLTHERRAPWVRPGGTTFHFVNDGIEAALGRAREAAGARDVRIGGGAHTIRAYLDAGLVDDFHLAIPPVLFGDGARLFDRVDPERAPLALARTVGSARVSHLFFRVRR